MCSFISWHGLDRVYVSVSQTDAQLFASASSAIRRTGISCRWYKTRGAVLASLSPREVIGFDSFESAALAAGTNQVAKQKALSHQR